MRKDWFEILRALTGSGISTAIITNGFEFSDRIISQLKDAKVESIAVSIDGNRRVHDFLRQNGSFDRALKAIDSLSAAKIPVSVISTLNSVNIKCLDELYDIFVRKSTDGNGIFAWQLQACSPMGNAANLDINYRFDHMEAIRFVEKHLDDNSFAIGVADNIGYFSDSEGYIRGNKSGRAFYKGCRAGLASIGIDSIGNIRGCESMYDDRFIEGNIRYKSLRDIWEDPDAFAYNRKFTPDMLTGKCSGCKYGHKCAGGCRSYNYFTTGELYNHRECVTGDGSL